MSKTHRVFRLLIAVIILLNVIFRYNLMLETFELRWVEGGWFSWLTVPLAIRGFIFLEAITVVILIFGARKTSLIWSFLVIVFYAVELWWNADNLYTGSVPYFCYFTNSTSMVMLFFLVGLNTYLLGSQQKLQWKLNALWQWAIATGFCILLFVLNPVEVQNFKTTTAPYEVGVSEWEPFFISLSAQHPTFMEKGKLLVPFFSTHCEVCMWYAQVIETARDYYNNDQVVAVFFESPEDISHFIEITHFQMPYVTIPIEMAFNLVGDGFPAFVIIEDGIVSKDLGPSQFNYAEIHHFFNSK
jgi:hypothetical protein